MLIVTRFLACAVCAASPIQPRDFQRDAKGTPRRAESVYTPRFEIRAADGGDVSGYLHDGKLAWRRRTADGHRAAVEAVSDGTLVADDSLALDHFGRVLARSPNISTLGPDASLAGVAGPVSWDQLFLLTEHSDEEDTFVAGPTIDWRGMGWAVITRVNGDDLTVQLTHTVAGTNNWQPPETIFQSTGFAIPGAPRIDHLGQVVVLFRRLSAGYHLEMLTYDPITHHAAHETVFSSEIFFQDEDFAIDADGNIVVVMDTDFLGVAALWNDGGEWHGPFGIPTPSSTSPPDLIHNTDGTEIYLLYSVAGQRFANRGVYTHRYLGASELFDTHSRVPGSRSIEFSLFVLTPPGVVDPAGEATVFYDARPLRLGRYHVRTNRTSNGLWQRPTTLVVLDQPVGITTGLEHADVSTSGDVLFLYESFEPRGKCVCGHHYSAETGRWSPRDTLLAWDTAFSQRVRVAYRGPTSAVATFNAPQPAPTGPTQLTSMLFDGSWQHTLLDIPEEHFSYVFSHATPPFSTEVLLIFSSNPGGWLLDTHYATLLRETAGQP